MTDARTAIRTLLIYVICIPLALTLGYLLANPFDVVGVTLVGTVFIVLLLPLLIQHHYAFMLFAWNMGAVVFFLPGRVHLWMVAVALSFAVSFTHRILDKKVRFLTVPQLTSPLLALLAVVLLTAMARGGIGLQSMGATEGGGRRYVALIMAIVGYFALTTRTIPLNRANWCVGLFLLSSVLSVVAMLYGRLPSMFNFIFLFIPPTGAAWDAARGLDVGAASLLRPFATAAEGMFAYLLARYGVREILTPGHLRLVAMFAGVSFLMVLSGSRLALIVFILTFGIQFWLEGLLRVRAVMLLGLGLFLAAVIVIPFASQMPYSIQRTLAVLPLELDPMVRLDADGSSEWRREIWRVTIPQIPEYLLVGKGYAMSSQDFSFLTDTAFAQRTVEDRAATVAGDYHNGPLSVIVPLGIWGVIAFIWLLVAGGRVLWCNYKHGQPALRIINTFLLANFLMKIVAFVFVFGGLTVSLFGFTGILGLSVALNGGVARPAGLPPPLPLRFAGRKSSLVTAANPKAPSLPPPVVHS